MLPIVEEIEKDFFDKVTMTWIDIDTYPDVIEQYNIQIVPTFIILREQIEVVRMAGMIGENVLRKRISDEDRL